ncbi:MAG TPA: ABC transporter ATP-binding protein, partial [Thermoanaerobaculia bacterium]|nr:ABC transporter ATP-binding protein [Thermoanaerobaculia bacterium]
MQPSAAATARRVSKDYPAGPRALDEVDLDLPRGAVTVLVGANGGGKTTLLRILAGLLPPSSGEVTVLDVPQPASAGRWRQRALRRGVGYVPQEVALDPEMTGRETLSLLATLHGVARRDRRRRIAELALAFGTADHLPRPVAAWSGGLKRRLHLAAGMIHDPELLLLDEPTAGLDDQGSVFLWAELARRAAAGRTVAVVTHDLAAAERHADRVVIVDGGRIVAAGSPA